LLLEHHGYEYYVHVYCIKLFVMYALAWVTVVTYTHNHVIRV